MVARKDGKPKQRHAPAVWALVREAYCHGASWRECEAEFGVTEAALRARAARHGWTKRATWGEAEAALDGNPGTPASADPADPLRIAERTLRRADLALSLGRSAEAQSIVKAGTSVGEFAELVKLLRAREGGSPP